MKQRICEALGEYGCYFLSILYCAERITKKSIDPTLAYIECLREGMIDSECYVKKPELIFARFTGRTVLVRKAPIFYKPCIGEIEILRFERKAENGILYSHFVVGDGLGGVVYDPYGESRTVKDGALVSKRIFKEII